MVKKRDDCLNVRKKEQMEGGKTKAANDSQDRQRERES